MRILSINLAHPEPHLIQEAVDVLKAGGVIAYPTDTCYGLGADISDATVIEKVFEIKKRPLKKSVSILIADLTDVEPYAVIDPLVEKLTKKYLPGKLTIVVHRKEGAPVIAGMETTIGFRIPDSPVSLALATALGRPLTTTSANISGGGECYSGDEVFKQFEHEVVQPDLILDGGALPRSQPSTVVMVENGQVKVLREGPVIVDVRKTRIH